MIFLSKTTSLLVSIEIAASSSEVDGQRQLLQQIQHHQLQQQQLQQQQQDESVPRFPLLQTSSTNASPEPNSSPTETIMNRYPPQFHESLPDDEEYQH